jgi:hypothetical protein
MDLGNAKLVQKAFHQRQHIIAVITDQNTDLAKIVIAH